MKKFAGLLVAFVALLSLTACGSKADFKCTGKIEGQDATVKGTVKDNKVTNINMEVTMESESEEQAKQAATMYEGFGSLAADSGMKMTAKASGKKLVITTDIDVEKAKAAQEKSGSDSSVTTSTSVDLTDASKDAIVKYFEKQGLSCK